MRFATFRQIAILTLATAVLLFGIDRLKNPRAVSIPGEVVAPSAGTDAPTIRVWLNDLGCGTCLSGLGKSLSEVAWLGGVKVLDKPPLPAREDEASEAANHRQQQVVEIKVSENDLARLDFVTVLAALRRAGFTPVQMEFSGLPHYRLEADLAPMCSPTCVEGTRAAMDDLVRAGRPKGSFLWLDSYNVDGVNGTLVVYPRMGASVDVMEVLGAINTIGFEAGRLVVRVHGAI